MQSGVMGVFLALHAPFSSNSQRLRTMSARQLVNVDLYSVHKGAAFLFLSVSSLGTDYPCGSGDQRNC